MLVSFFESLKYVGHLVPMAVLRIAMGYYYLQEAIGRFHGGFLTEPQLAASLGEWLPKSEAPLWYKDFIEIVVISEWLPFAYFIVVSQFVIGLSFLLGYLVRPFAVLALFISFNYVLLVASPLLDLHKVLLLVSFTLGWLGAGRCLGIDYYFFKKRRGIWW